MSEKLRRALLSVSETRECAAALGRVVEPGDQIALVGDLGAGKTHFVQGLGLGLEVPDIGAITSPTFALLNEVEGGRVPLLHGDLYRIEDERELEQIGIYEACDDRRVVALEWADKFEVLVADHLEVTLRITGDDQRELEAVAHGDDSRELLSRWRGALEASPKSL